jgi:DNA-binding MarR family transcriptional regulator
MPGSAPQRPVIDRHVYAPHYLMIIANALSAGASRLYLQRLDLGINEGRIVAVLGHEPGKTALEIGQAMMINKSIISRSLRTLMARELVRAAGTGRGCRYTLTGEGTVIHDAIVRMAFDREELLLAGIAPAERRALVRLLARMLANVETMNRYEPDPDL